MGIRWAAAAIVLCGLATSSVRAQNRIDVDRLPIDLQRIHQELRQSSIREDRNGLNIRYVVDVFAPAPPIVLFNKEDNVLTGLVPYGGPTHKEMLEQMTPKEFRVPVADFSALLRWLAGLQRR